MKVKWAQCFLPQQKLTPLHVTHAVHSFRPSTACLSNVSVFSDISHSLRCLSLHMSPSPVGGDRRGTGRQLMMKYDPVICGLSAVGVVRERESSDVYWEVATDGRRFLFFFPPHCITSTCTIHSGLGSWLGGGGETRCFFYQGRNIHFTFCLCSFKRPKVLKSIIPCSGVNSSHFL